MKKIPTIFIRDWQGNKSLVTQEPNPECNWVFNGEGVPTRKWDGTSCLVKDRVLYKRYELKSGKTPPDGFFPAQEVDSETGKQPGWVPVGDGPDDKAYREAVQPDRPSNVVLFADGTYELVGPKVQSNPDGYAQHTLVRHGEHILHQVTTLPKTYDAFKTYLEFNAIEGIVWHHPDGRMAKLKARDMGLKWPR